MLIMKTEQKKYATLPGRLNKSLHVINQINLFITEKSLGCKHRDKYAFRQFIKI